MGVERVHPVPVVEHDQLAEEVELGRQRDPARAGGQHRRADRPRHVQPVMRLARLSVQDALAAVDAANAPAGRPAQPVGEVVARGVGAAGPGQDLAFAADALQRRGVRRHLARRQAGDALHIPRPRGHRDLARGAAHGEAGARAVVAPEAEREGTTRRDADGLPVQRKALPGGALADQQRPLRRRAAPAERPSRTGEECGREGEGEAARDHAASPITAGCAG